MFFAFALESLALMGMLSVCAFFAASEHSLAAANKSRLHELARLGNLKAHRAVEVARSYSRFLASMRLGAITLTVFSGTLAGVWSAAAIAALPMASLWTHTAVALGAALILSLVTLFFGELLPRRVAQRNPEAVAMAVSSPLTVLFGALAPFARHLDRAAEALLRLLGLEPPADGAALAEEEIRTLVREGAATGVFEKSEREMVERVLVFGDRKVASLMTPRPDIVWLDVEESMAAHRDKMRSSPHAHFPVARGGLDSLLGTVHVKDFLCRKSFDDCASISEFVVPALFVPESMNALELLERFKNTGRHIAFVIDEFGAVLGLATMTDILEALVGSLPNGQRMEMQVTRLKADVWVVDGGLAIDEFRRLFALGRLPDEERAGFLTVAGFLLSLMGRIPREGETAEWAGFHFHVERMRANRIDKVRVVLAEPAFQALSFSLAEQRHPLS